jgi:RES domain-containing protein
MEVYNIRKAKFALELKASGVANRWNREEEYVIYTGSSISLATLELLAHRAGIDVKTEYKLLFITLNITETDIRKIEAKDLAEDWRSISSYPTLQRLGSNWYRDQRELVLQVPSALVPWENNYLINSRHPDFADKVRISKREDYPWDSRLI